MSNEAQKKVWLNTKHRALEIYTNGMLSYWDEGRTNFHVGYMRTEFIEMLGKDREAVIEMLAETINDTHDVDVTDEHYAAAILDRLLETIAPYATKGPTDEGDVAEILI